MKRILVLLLILSSFAFAQRHGGGSHHSSSGSHHSSSSNTHPRSTAYTGASSGIHSPRSRSSASPVGSHKYTVHAHASAGQKSTHHRDAGYRVNRDVSQSTKNTLYKNAGIPKSERKNYVIDHRVALENGGTNDISNLQVQSKSDARAKDKIENREAAARRHTLGVTKSKHRKH